MTFHEPSTKNTALTRLRAFDWRHLTFPSQKCPIPSIPVTAFTLLTPDCFPPGTNPPPDCLLTRYKLAASIQERLLCLGQSTPPTWSFSRSSKCPDERHLSLGRNTPDGNHTYRARWACRAQRAGKKAPYGARDQAGEMEIQGGRTWTCSRVTKAKAKGVSP